MLKCLLCNPDGTYAKLPGQIGKLVQLERDKTRSLFAKQNPDDLFLLGMVDRGQAFVQVFLNWS